MTTPRPTAAMNQAAQPDTSIYITRFPTELESRGSVITFEGWSALFAAFKASTEDPDGPLPAWSPCTFERNIRSASEVETVNALVLRYPGIRTKPREAFDFWTDDAFGKVITCLTYTKDCDRPDEAPFYVVLPFRVPVSRAQFEQASTAIQTIASHQGHEVAVSPYDPSEPAPWPSRRTRCLGPREGSTLVDAGFLAQGTVDTSVSEPSGERAIRPSSSIDRWVQDVRVATQDPRAALNKSAFVVGLQIGRGNVEEASAVKELVKAGIDAGLGATKAEQVVERAVREGKAKATLVEAADKWDDARLKKTKTGSIDGSQVSNVILILKEHPSWKNVVRYSEFDHRVHLIKPPFKNTFYAGKTKDQKWIEDNDLTCARSWLETALDVSVSKEALIDAMVAVGMSQSFHPVREWLDSLVWDGVSRIQMWLKDYCGAEVETDAQKIAVPAMSARWLMSAVARAYEPGAKVDCTLVLEGEQSIRKSTTFATLVPNPTWFSDERLHLDSKDTLQQIQGKWIIEIAELASFKGKANEEIKHFLTKKSDDFRMPYAKLNQSFDRQCVFGGTVNDSEYLSDPTGNRRFFPIRCHGLDTLGGKIDIAGLSAVRDQLWAEAVHRYKNGEQWWLTEAEEEAARTEQEARFTSDAWEAPVAAWVATYDGDGQLQDRFTMADVLRSAVNIDLSKQGKAEQSRMKQILNRLGFVRKQVTIDGARVHRYCRTR